MRLFLAASYPEAVGGVKSLSSIYAECPECVVVGQDRRERERETCN
jgi:hypothetical protein